MTAAVELREVTKSFPGSLALDRVSLTVEEGEVHALLGENGAGKSTLIKVVSGVHWPDQGRVWIGGTELTRSSPRAAQELGVRVIHQERQIAPDLSVAENLLLGQLPVGRGLLSHRRLERVARERLSRLGVDLDPAAPARSLGVAQQQLLELCRAVSFDARLVIMDEPTASLHREEVENLFGIVRRLREHGVAVLYISHHLDEIFAVANRVTVLRDGKVAGTRHVFATTTDELIPLIFGKSVCVSRSEVRAGNPAPERLEGHLTVVSARKVSYRQAVRSVSLDVHPGEIVALTGALGSGASEMAQLLSGCLNPTSGTVLHGSPPRRYGSRTNHTRRGVAYLPSDRKRQGLLLEQSVRDNVILSRLALPGEPLTRCSRNHQRAVSATRRLAIKTRNIHTPVRLLSGGNQQKCILARWLEVGSRLFVFDEPTAGVDISSKLELYHLLMDATAGGVAVVMVSSDYEEIAAVADRVVVMRDGQVVGEMTGDEATADSLIRMEIGV